MPYIDKTTGEKKFTLKEKNCLSQYMCKFRKRPKWKQIKFLAKS